MGRELKGFSVLDLDFRLMIFLEGIRYMLDVRYVLI